MRIEKNQIDGSTLLNEIKSGKQKTLEHLYNENRKPFLVWASQTYRCSEEDSVEIYQKAFTILYLNIKNNKLTTLTSSLKTYLFSIGKNLFREKFRDKHNRLVNLDDVSNIAKVNEQVDSSILDKNYKNNHQKELVRKLLNEIGDPCRKLLQLMFIQGYAADAVVREMGYSDERVVRKRKSLCLKKMREMVALRRKSDLL